MKVIEFGKTVELFKYWLSLVAFIKMLMYILINAMKSFTLAANEDKNNSARSICTCDNGAEIIPAFTATAE